MLEDEELGPNFLQTLKSQGVREVSDSVMTFRVKFTVKPGKQFLIRREAIKRITLALEKEGIHYAHRKGIVDFPAPSPSVPHEGGSQADDPSDKATVSKSQPGTDLASASAAAALVTILEEEKKDCSNGRVVSEPPVADHRQQVIERKF